MRKTTSLPGLVAALLLALSLTVPVAAQVTPDPHPNPKVREAADLVNSVIADPAKREALCAYHAALQGIGKAQENSGVAVGRDAVSREAQRQQNQVDAMRRLGTAQGEARAAAEQVGPRFNSAVETLRFGDMYGYIGTTLKLQKLCSQP